MPGKNKKEKKHTREIRMFLVVLFFLQFNDLHVYV